MAWGTNQMGGTYYNEFDPFAAQTLRNLIAAGHIAPGDVDERSIEDVHPDDIRSYTQCHFFAGIGVWSLALRRAGWDDTRRIWTGSCPCQPFSAAGKGDGFADERHLWPAFFHLITQCAPPVVLGEQVASKAVDPWIDLVQADMEALGYGFGAVAFPSAGVGAPHIRDRTYWLADSDSRQQSGPAELRGAECDGSDAGRAESSGQLEPCGDDGGLGDSCVQRLHWFDPLLHGDKPGRDSQNCTEATWAGPWDNPDWVLCRDPNGPRWRPVEPGTFPLAHGLARGVGALNAGLRGLADMAGIDGSSLKRAKSYRVGALKAYGNAINAYQAEQFIRAYMYD